MRRLFLALILPIFGAFAVAAEAIECDARFLRNGVSVNIERALDRGVIKLEDVKAMIESSTAYNPFAILTRTPQNGGLIDFFAAAISDSSWPHVQSALQQVYGQRTNLAIVTEEARTATENVVTFDLWQTVDVKQPSDVEWKITSDGTIYFYVVKTKEVYRLDDSGPHLVIKANESHLGEGLSLRDGRAVFHTVKSRRSGFFMHKRFFIVETDLLSGAETIVQSNLQSESVSAAIERLRQQLENASKQTKIEKYNKHKRSSVEEGAKMVLSKPLDFFGASDGNFTAYENFAKNFMDRELYIWQEGDPVPRVQFPYVTDGRSAFIEFFESGRQVYALFQSGYNNLLVFRPNVRNDPPIEVDIRSHSGYFKILASEKQLYIVPSVNGVTSAIPIYRMMGRAN